ncbi:BLUF domain-containing protein, partial [Vibrio sp. M260118]|uniref:BLUF domain-containing protein n=1 Tax=Vibrio sp. M260118 TaxID=3020896 RepID=UPI002F4072D2
MSDIRLIYVSTVSAEFKMSSFDEIMFTAQERNRANDITGVLYFSPKYFMQYLEGEQVNVAATFARIEKDPRHTDILVVDKQPITARQFGEWSMAYILQPELLEPLNLQFMNSPHFNPYLLNAESANQIITELRHH